MWKKVTHTTAYPIVVMKLVVNEPSENLKSRQLLPTPTNEEHLVNTILENKEKHKPLHDQEIRVYLWISNYPIQNKVNDQVLWGPCLNFEV